MYTPEEARNNGCSTDRTATCLGNACMAWRWQPLMADGPFVDAVAERMKSEDESHNKAIAYVKANRAEFGLPTSPTHGFCGLAGVPLQPFAPTSTAGT